MLEIKVAAKEWWDENKNLFIETPSATLQLEHSLLSISRWESKWKVPFMDVRNNKTTEQTIDYIRCMTINRNIKSYVYASLSSSEIDQILNYIEDSHTATTIRKMGKKGGGREIVTSELIYYWMIIYGIPFECQKWNLNRLLTLIEICEVKQNPKKMGKNEILRSNAQLNAARRAKLHTKG